MKHFLSTPLGSILGSLLFAVVGIFLLNQTGLVPKVIGVLSVLFFGGGALLLIWRNYMQRQKQKEDARPCICASSIGDVMVEKQNVNDDEVLEVWERVGTNLNKSLQGISAIKSIGDEFEWSVMVSSGEFFRSGDVATAFNNEIYQSLAKVPGVKTVVHEDNEYWAVDGDCHGKALVEAASLANDAVLLKYQAGDFDQ
ncbi:hypothetical protein GCM10009133_17000 [Cocleimonas flava]|uniref:Uncharacterized protein n=1 Tax=Cocleimonas flava TaxID=634765 RepID=A0A4R1ESQ8_9GAMM|nr:hypothetical protein [Cocleimonas flava]TCJ84626.1 hypothetical protein EV695_2585 [Cocleimonas flava]